MRINKYIASCGVTSRRKADSLVLSGKVYVNGTMVTDFIDVDETSDIVEINGERIFREKTKYYIALNKPVGFITSVGDDRGRQSVTDLTADIDARIFPVGRLDFNTSGLLLMTNDGDFANSVTHPSRKIYKTYLAHVSGFPSPKAIESLKRGIELSDGLTAPAKVKTVKAYPASCDIEISIYEGKKRQVRRMFEKIGCEVLALKRTSVGNVLLGNIPEGRWRHLTKQEILFFSPSGKQKTYNKM